MSASAANIACLPLPMIRVRLFVNGYLRLNLLIVKIYISLLVIRVLGFKDSRVQVNEFFLLLGFAVLYPTDEYSFYTRPRSGNKMRTSFTWTPGSSNPWTPLCDSVSYHIRSKYRYLLIYLSTSTAAFSALAMDSTILMGFSTAPAVNISFLFFPFLSFVALKSKEGIFSKSNNS